jgi:hypothetical protein
MIDDFRVPADPRFGWDRYDDGEICLGYIADLVHPRDEHLPSYPATDEEATWRGAASPRGYCVIGQSAGMRDVLDGITLLQRTDAMTPGSIGHRKDTHTLA